MTCARNPKILHVEDNANVRSYVKPALESSGYDYVEAADGPSALDALERENPDLMVLDIMLQDPDYGGLDLCKEIREMGNRTPVIFLTVLDRASDPRTMQRAFELGADDYVGKREELLRIENALGIPPAEFLEHKSDMQELLLRIRLKLSSSQSTAEENPATEFGNDLKVDLESGVSRVRRSSGWEEHILTGSELAIFRFLSSRRGRVVGRNQIIDAVDTDGTMTERSVEAHVSRLRGKIEPDPNDFSIIITVPRLGYRFAQPY